MQNIFIDILPPWVETGLQPAFYDLESGTVLQQTARMYAKVRELTEAFNTFSENVTNEVNDFEDRVNATVEEYIEKFTELHDYVHDYFDNLDVQEEINNKLDEMTESGVLTVLISEYLTNQLLEGYYNKSPYINYSRIMRRMKKTDQNPSYSASDYYLMQGGVYLGNDVFVQANIKSDGVLLEKFNMTTGVVIANNVLNLQHCNSMAYDTENHVIYATSLIDSSSNHTHYLYKIDPCNLSLIETHEFTSLQDDEGLHSVAYDVVTGKLYVGVEQDFTNNLTIYEVGENYSLTDCELVNYRKVLGDGGGSNDITVNNNILYILKHIPKTIVTYDLTTKQCIQIYNLSEHNDFGYRSGEPQNISYDVANDNIIFGSYVDDTQNGWFALQSYYIVAINHGLATALSTDAQADVTVYVDASATGINPTGAYSNPFATIGEALDVRNRAKCKSLLIYVRDGSYPFVNMVGVDNTRITAVNTSDDVTIGGLKIKSCNNLQIVGATVLEARNSYNYDINIERSRLLLSNIKCGGTHTAHIRVYSSELTFSNIVSKVSGTVYKIENDVFMIPLGNQQKMSMTDDSSTNVVFAKPILIGNFNALSNTVTTISTVGNENLLKSADIKKLRVCAVGSYNQTSADMNTQPNDGGNRNMTVVLDSKLVTIQWMFNYTNHTISAQITKAIDLKNLSFQDITSTMSGACDLYYVGA